MNILSFITTILIVFSIISSFMIKAHKDTASTFKSVKGYFVADTNLKNSYEKVLYDTQKRKKTPTEKTESQGTSYPLPGGKEKKDKKKKKVRKIHPCGLINLLALTKTENFEKKEQYSFFIKILKIFYPSEFSKKITAEKFANTLISNLKNLERKKIPIDLEKINFKNIYYQTIWYFLLKGSNDYTFEEKIKNIDYLNQYPSILEFITYDRTSINNNFQICINKTSKEIIYALYGNQISQKIFKIKSNNKKIKKKTLEKILQNANNLDIEKNLALFCYTHNNSHPLPQRIIAKDEKNKVSLYKKEY